MTQKDIFHKTEFDTLRASPDKPWLGLSHYTPKDSAYFYGRETEIYELYQRVRRAPLTVLFGLSGYGKSSLLGGGLIPKLEASGYSVSLLRRCYYDLASKPLSQEVQQTVINQGVSTFTPSPEATLWEFYHHRKQAWFLQTQQDSEVDEISKSNGAGRATQTQHAKIPVLIFDQFEDIFIHGEDRKTNDPEQDALAQAGARDFLTQLADLVENRPPESLRTQLKNCSSEEKRRLVSTYDFNSRPVSVVIAIRADFLARFERCRHQMPAMMEQRVELRLLSGPQAYKAVYYPGTKRPDQCPIIAQDAAEDLVRAAARATRDTPLDKIEAVPPILSLLCERLNNRRLRSNPMLESITSTDFSTRDTDKILNDFCEEKFKPHPKALRDFLEDKLVSDSGFRESIGLDSAIYQLAYQLHIPNAEESLHQLISDRILIIEERGGRPRIEFTHDTLANLALKHRSGRKAQQRRIRSIMFSSVFCIALILIMLTSGALRERDNANLKRDKAETERSNAQTMVREASRSDYASAIELLNEKQWLKSVSHLGRALRYDSENSMARAGLISTLSYGQIECCTVKDVITPPLKHEGIVLSASFSPDGTKVITGSSDGTARIWSLDTGLQVGATMKHEGTVLSASFSPDGTKVITGSFDKTARIWSLDTGLQVGAAMKHEGAISSASFSPDGTKVITGSFDGTARIWNLDTGLQVGTAMKHVGAVFSTSFSPDGTKVITGSSDKIARIWNLDTGLQAIIQHDEAVSSASFSPDGTKVITGSFDKTARIWSIDTGQQIGAPMKHEGAVSSASFSPDGTKVITGSADGKARIWSLDTGLQATMKHDGAVSSASFSPDGTKVITGSSDKIARIWNLDTGLQIGAAIKHDGAVSSASFSPDGTKVITGTYDNTARIWSIDTGLQVGATMKHESAIFSASFSPDGTKLITGSEDKTARIWSLDTGLQIGATMKHDGTVFSASFSPDGAKVITGSSDGTARIWSAEGLQVGATMNHDGTVFSASFSPDGTKLITGSDDKTARIWSIDTGLQVGATMKHDGTVFSASFSPDGTKLITGSDDKTARIWSIDTGLQVGATMKHESAIFSASFSPDGTKVITGSSDKTASIWSVNTGLQVGATMKHEGTVLSASFSPDGTKVITGSEDKTARIWSVDTTQSLPSELAENIAIVSTGLILNPVLGNLEELSFEDFNSLRIKVLEELKDPKFSDWMEAITQKMPLPFLLKQNLVTIQTARRYENQAEFARLSKNLAEVGLADTNYISCLRWLLANKPKNSKLTEELSSAVSKLNETIALFFELKNFTGAAYFSKESTELAKIAYDRNPSDSNLNDLILQAGNASFRLLFVRDYRSAENYARQAIALNTSQQADKKKDITLIYGTLAHALLFQNKYQEALKIYKQYWNTKNVPGFKSFADAVTNDFERLEAAHITHKDITRLKAALR